MKLEKMLSAGSGQSRLQLLFEDGTKLKVTTFLAADHGLYPGMELSDEQMQALKADASRAQTRERAVRCVAASAVSEKQLREKLVRAGAEQADAQETVDWMRELGLLDDAQTATQIVRSAAAKGYGAARIKNILYEKGIPKPLWDEALSELPDMSGAIDRFLHQKLDGRVSDDKLVKKTVDALLRRGHRWSEIRQALARYEIQPQFDDGCLEDPE